MDCCCCYSRLTLSAVPQGSKVNELRALVRKNRAQILGDNVSASAASAFGAATSKAGNQYAKATDDATLAAQDAFDKVVNSWSETRLKAYLDARGVPVPQGSKTAELQALVRRNAHKAAHPYSAWTWDDLSYDNLKKYLASSGNAAAKKVGDSSSATRDELVEAAQSAYSSASSAGGGSYASATSYLAQATESAKKSTFDTWSESELKAYLDSYGIVSSPFASKTFNLYSFHINFAKPARPPGLHHQRAQGRGAQAVDLLQVRHHEPGLDRLREARR